MNVHKPYYLLLCLVVGLPLICCLSGISFWVVRERSNHIALQRLSHTLDIAPNWRSLYIYLDDHIKPGMPKEAVLQELDKIAPYTVRPQGNCELVAFKADILNITSYAVAFCYKDDDVQSLRYHAIED